VDNVGRTIDVLLTTQQDCAVTQRSLTKAIRRHSIPAMITIDGSTANAAPIERYNARMRAPWNTHGAARNVSREPCRNMTQALHL
jgi:transposase-like protein